MIQNVFRLDDRQIASLMVPRSDVVYLDIEEPLEENIKQIENSEHSHFPVLKGSWEEILGVVRARQFLTQTLRGKKPSLTENLYPPVFVPESLTGIELLENFKHSGTNLAFVIDEYGEVQGIVTLKDVMEAITGEFKPKRPEDAWAVRRDDGTGSSMVLFPCRSLRTGSASRKCPKRKGAATTHSVAWSCCCWKAAADGGSVRMGRTGRLKSSTSTASASTRSWQRQQAPLLPISLSWMSLQDKGVIAMERDAKFSRSREFNPVQRHT